MYVHVCMRSLEGAAHCIYVYTFKSSPTARGLWKCYYNDRGSLLINERALLHFESWGVVSSVEFPHTASPSACLPDPGVHRLSIATSEKKGMKPQAYCVLQYVHMYTLLSVISLLFYC